MLLIWGSKNVNLGIDEFFISCPSCESYHWADSLIVCSYFHIWFIPMFPKSKEVNLICTHCGLKRYDIPFKSKTLDGFEHFRRKYRYPWYTYIGAVVIGWGIAAFILTLILQAVR